MSNPNLSPTSVVSTARPRSGILWLTKPHVRPLLGQIATAQVPLTHEGIATLTPRRSATYVRDLLVAVCTLPPVDRELFGFEQWLPLWLGQVQDPEQRKTLTRYATWQVLRHLRDVAGRGPIGHYRQQDSRYRLRQAAAWLRDLEADGSTLATCSQDQLDRWFANAKTHQRTKTGKTWWWQVV